MNISGDGVRLEPLIANDSYKRAFFRFICRGHFLFFRVLLPVDYHTGE